MLTIDNISKSYNGRPALNGISLTVYEKEMVSIMGKSGGGKSTLLAVIAVLLRPDTGRVLFYGETISDLDEEKLAAFRLQHIGFIFQDFKLIPSLTVRDNILLALYPRRDIRTSEKEDRIREFAGQVGLADRMGERVDNLSGGEKQRVAVARSLVNRPAWCWPMMSKRSGGDPFVFPAPPYRHHDKYPTVGGIYPTEVCGLQRREIP